MPDGAEKSYDLMVAGGSTGGDTAALRTTCQALPAANAAGVGVADVTAYQDGAAGRPHRGLLGALKARSTQVVQRGGELPSDGEVAMLHGALRESQLTLT